MVPRVCRKWSIPFSLVEARTEIWIFYFGRITYITREFGRVVLWYGTHRRSYLGWGIDARASLPQNGTATAHSVCEQARHGEQEVIVGKVVIEVSIAKQQIPPYTQKIAWHGSNTTVVGAKHSAPNRSQTKIFYINTHLDFWVRNQNCALSGATKIAPKASVRSELHTCRCAPTRRVITNGANRTCARANRGGKRWRPPPQQQPERHGVGRQQCRCVCVCVFLASGSEVGTCKAWDTNLYFPTRWRLFPYPRTQ